MDISHLEIKQHLEELEKRDLSPLAALSSKSRRDRQLEFELTYQTDFQHDRQKILESKAFRRLKNKTQVFLNPTDDHYRTRLTHTLEVSDISKNIAKALRLNADLAEAIALSHDIGHAPFGHVGEEALNEMCEFGFEHEKQGRRVVETLENKGLNLTLEIRDGIEKHDYSKNAMTLEGQIVKFADKIAYICHDIDDAFKAGVINESSFPEEYIRLFGKTFSDQKSKMIRSVIKSSYEKPVISMLEKHAESFNNLRKYMFTNVYHNKAIRSKEMKVKDKIKKLFDYYMKNPRRIPSEFKEEEIRIRVCDYVSSMTDCYALRTYDGLFKR